MQRTASNRIATTDEFVLLSIHYSYRTDDEDSQQVADDLDRKILETVLNSVTGPEWSTTKASELQRASTTGDIGVLEIDVLNRLNSHLGFTPASIDYCFRARDNHRA